MGKSCFACFLFLTNNRRFTVNRSRAVYRFPLYHLITLSWKLLPHVCDWKNPAAIHTPQPIGYHLSKNIQKPLHSPCSEDASCSPSSPPSTGILLPSPFPLLLLITLSSVLGDFLSETHPDFSLIPASPSVTFPPFCSPYCRYSFNSLSLHLCPFSLSLLLHTYNPADLRTYTD